MTAVAASPPTVALQREEPADLVLRLAGSWVLAHGVPSAEPIARPSQGR